MPYKDPQAKAANDRAYYIANKERIRARSAEYRKSHLAEERKANAAWRNANRERSNEIKANWKKAHPDKVNAREKMLRDNLSDDYIRRKMAQHTTMKSRDIPQTLVDAHRELLRLKRELRNEKL